MSSPGERILVIDDIAFWRDTVSDLLRANGYEIHGATDGLAGLAALDRWGADLIILDVDLPNMAGLDFLEQIRQRDAWKAVPVIVLTGEMRKDYIIRAGQLGAADYLLKSRFSTEHLIQRVQVRMTAAKKRSRPGRPASAQSAAPVKRVAAPQIAAAAPAASFTPSATAAKSDIPQLLDRERCLKRAHEVMEGRTLSGVVAGVINMAMSPRTELSELASLIGRDPVLTARVLRAANSAAYTARQGMVSTINEAVRNIGCAGVRDIAAATAVFDAMPATAGEGFNPVRCWEHSLAVASLCGQLAQKNERGVAYLAGLCHDLGEIFFHSHFGVEYSQVIEVQKTSGKSRNELERQMLGMTHGELAKTIFKCLQLPEAICKPIEHFHSSSSRQAVDDPLARLLQVADNYANGILLASSDDSPLRGIARTEYRAVTGHDEPLKLDVPKFRSEIISLTAMLARLSAADEKRLNQQLLAHQDVRLWLARDPSLSPFDPIASALELLADVKISDGLPKGGEWPGHDGLIVVARASNAKGFMAADIQNALSQMAYKPPLMWLAGHIDENDRRNADQPAPVPWPVRLDQLAGFVQTIRALPPLENSA